MGLTATFRVTIKTETLIAVTPRVIMLNVVFFNVCREIGLLLRLV